ncbi:hypothetical protein [Actinomadura sp. GTD37]|uniref:hypothetical protein n=1 Tax=Actinomadura sp. GTD37 TaxID=1778030 RepID=UPI0035C0EB5E
MSRALSGRQAPSLHLIVAMAEVLGVDVTETRELWQQAVVVRRDGRTSQANGGPPWDLDSYPSMLQALRDLLASRGLLQRAVVRQDESRCLMPSTVSAVLRGERDSAPGCHGHSHPRNP